MAEDRLTGLALLATCTDITVTPDAVLDIFFQNNRPVRPPFLFFVSKLIVMRIRVT